jgi:hypothetical protein
MSPRATAILVVVLSILAIALPQIAALFTQEGWVKAAQIIGTIGGIAGILKIAVTDALQNLPSSRTPAKIVPPLPVLFFTVLLVALFAACATAQKVFSDIQTGCIAEALATSVIPPGTPVAMVATDVELVCDLVLDIDKDVQAAVTEYEAEEAEAGVSATTYIPSPMATRKRGVPPSHDAGANEGGHVDGGAK